VVPSRVWPSRAIELTGRGRVVVVVGGMSDVAVGGRPGRARRSAARVLPAVGGRRGGDVPADCTHPRSLGGERK
jgi:hypothetical protein